MNIYGVVALLVSFVAWSGFMYYEGGDKQKVVCSQADEKHDLAQTNNTVAAQSGVIDTVAKQQSTSQGVDNAYQTKKSLIDNQYAADFGGVLGQTPAPAVNSLPAAGSTTCRPNAAPARPFRTAFFKLNAQECDDNTEQLYGLQDWVRKQQAVK